MTDVREQHDDLCAAHSRVKQATGDSGSDSDLSEYEQDMRQRTATAFDVGSVDPTILDRGVWKGEDVHAQTSGVQTAGTNSLPVRQWSMTPDAAAMKVKQAPLGTQAALLKQAGTAVKPKAKAAEFHRLSEDANRRHLRKLQELSASLKDVQEGLREPGCNGGEDKEIRGKDSITCASIQNAGIDWPSLPPPSTLHAARIPKGLAWLSRKAAKGGKATRSRIALGPPGQEWVPADLPERRTDDGAYIFQPLPLRGDRNEVAFQMHAFKDETARKTAGKYIESMRGNFWTSAQKNDGQWVLRAPGQDRAHREKQGSKRIATDAGSQVQSLRLATQSDGETFAKAIEQDLRQDDVIKCSTPVRQVVDAARREVRQHDEVLRSLPKRGESLTETRSGSSPEPGVPLRSKTNIGTYWRQEDGKSQHSQGHVNPAERESDDHILAVGLVDDLRKPSRPFFFRSEHLKDPVHTYREEKRMRKRDGSVRDRLGRADHEAAIRSKMRSLDVDELLANRQALGGVDAVASPANHVQRELRRALNLLHEDAAANDGSMALNKIAPVTLDIEMRLMLDRMGKGQSAMDVKLLARKDAYLPPKLHTHLSDSKSDTSQLPAKKMIAAHAQMLAEHARLVTKDALKTFKESEDAKLDELRKESWDVVQRWEELLAQLPRIRKATDQLCSVSINWQGALAHDSEVIKAFLRTGVDDRASEVVDMPDIRSMILHHPDAYASEMRRKKIRQALEKLSEQKKVLLKSSEAVVDKKASLEATLAPVRKQLQLLSDKITHALGNRGTEQEQAAKEQKILHEKLDHLELSFKNSAEVEALDRISGSIITTFMSMDSLLEEEEACIAKVSAEETFMKTVLAHRESKEAELDLKKKIDYLCKMNPEQMGSVGEVLVSMVARVCLEPDNEEWKTINASSRSSPIHAILACKGGFDVLTAFTFYHAGSVWCLPHDVDTARMQAGCEHLCVMLGIPDRILLRQVEKQKASVAADLLQKMMTSEDQGPHQQGSRPSEVPPAEQHSHQNDVADHDHHDVPDEQGDGKVVGAGRWRRAAVAATGETAQEKALVQLFKRLDKDGGGSLSADEIKLALEEYNIDEERPSAVHLLEEVASCGEQGMGLGAFKASMLKLLTEPIEEDDPLEGMDEDTVARVKQMIKMLFNGQLAQGWDTWKAAVDKQQIDRTGALENYKRVCQVLTISPSISTLFRRFLQSRSESALDLSNRGMSPLAFKAFACGMCGWSPDFVKIEKMGMVPKDYVIAHPEETFAAACDPCVNVFELRKHGACESLTALDLSNNAGGAECARDLQQILVKTLGCLQHLNLSSNKIGEDGGRFLAEALMDGNAPPLVTLRVGHNKMGDKTSAQLVSSVAGSDLVHSLELLNMCGNDCGYESCDELGKLLSDAACQLEHLDLGWNLIRGESGAQLLNGLASNSSLKYLDIGWNGIDVEACGSLGKCLETCMLEELDLNHCNITGAGALLIADGLKRNKLLRRITLDCNNLKQSASGAHLDESGAERIISLVDCNLQSVDSTTFNKAEPAGRYALDLGDAYDRSTFKELLRIVYAGKGAFALQPLPRVDTYYDGTWKEYRIPLPDQDDEDAWEMPPTCLIEFAFASLLSSDNASEMSSNEVEWLLNELNAPGKTERDRIGAIKAFCEGDTYLRFDQVEGIISQLPEDSRSLERCELVKQCFSRLTEAERAVEMLELLTINERQAVEKKLGLAAITFTKNNATGRYVLDLSKKPERDICIRLCEINNSQTATVERIRASSNARKGGARAAIERTWRNALFEEEPQTFSSTWAVPRKGFLELDFVQITKPTSDHNLTTDDEFLVLLERLRRQSDDDKLVSVRDWLNRKVVLCEQVEDLLTLFKREQDRKSLRVEIMVSAFARVLDWHGYTSLLSLISIAEFNLLVKRIGLVNLFDEVMAVGYHELDLAVTEERFVAQELVHLAMVEPGENMVDCQYNGVDFPLPVGWGVEVPKKGALSFYYCREEAVIETVSKRGCYDSSDYPYAINGEIPELHRTRYGVWYLKDFLHEGMPQPAGAEWVRHVRMRRIKMKMLKSASKAQDMFALLDNDGGGSLDRKEMAVGLFRLGVWLQPSELAALMEALDEDGGGEIDLAEFSTWWDATALLPPRRLKSAASRWKARIGSNKPPPPPPPQAEPPVAAQSEGAEAASEQVEQGALEAQPGAASGGYDGGVSMA